MPGLRSSAKFDLAFKLRVIEEAKRGKLSHTELGKKYGIQGHSTIKKWMRKLDGKAPILSKQNDHELRVLSYLILIVAYGY